jgi:endo-1,4-beta-xylanase
MLTRRRTIKGAAAGLILAGAAQRWPARGEAVPVEEGPASDRPLGQQAQAHGLLYGAAVEYAALLDDPDLADAVARECALLAPENDAKWERLRPVSPAFDFTRLDGLADFARAHGMAMRGHPLIWHSQLPRWFDGVVDRDNAEAFLIGHIETVAGRYAGRMHSWDVVNEAVWLEDGRADGLRHSPWLALLGPRYLDLAFRTARAADPKARLVYNDFGIEYDDDWCAARRAVILDLLSGLIAGGAPIDAVGLQAHLEGGRAPAFGPLLAFIDELFALGLEVMITELDVTDKELPADIGQRDRMVAEAYEGFLGAVLPHPAVTTLVTWGLADPQSWLNEFQPRADGLPPRPLPLDHQYRRKPCWNAMSRALSRRQTSDHQERAGRQ